MELVHDDLGLGEALPHGAPEAVYHVAGAHLHIVHVPCLPGETLKETEYRILVFSFRDKEDSAALRPDLPPLSINPELRMREEDRDVFVALVAVFVDTDHPHIITEVLSFEGLFHMMADDAPDPRAMLADLLRNSTHRHVRHKRQDHSLHHEGEAASLAGLRHSTRGAFS